MLPGCWDAAHKLNLCLKAIGPLGHPFRPWNVRPTTVLVVEALRLVGEAIRAGAKAIPSSEAILRRRLIRPNPEIRMHGEAEASASVQHVKVRWDQLIARRQSTVTSSGTGAGDRIRTPER